MQLSTMEPNPVWDPDSYAETVDAWAAVRDDITVKVWGGDWCVDCRNQLPDFAAALDAAGVPDDAIEHYPVEKEDDGSKTGPLVEEYDIEYIPTVVVERVASVQKKSRSDFGDATTNSNGERSELRERDGDELARFVEDEDEPIAVWLAERLEAEATP